MAKVRRSRPRVSTPPSPPGTPPTTPPSGPETGSTGTAPKRTYRRGGAFLDDDFDDLVSGLKPGRVVPQILRYRQGGDARSWAQPGSTSYVPRGAFLMAGSSRWTGAAATSGNKAVILKVPYPETPIVLVTVVDTTPLFEGVWFQASCDGPVLYIYWWSTNALTSIWFHWLCMGPGAV